MRTRDSISGFFDLLAGSMLVVPDLHAAMAFQIARAAEYHKVVALCFSELNIKIKLYYRGLGP